MQFNKYNAHAQTFTFCSVIQQGDSFYLPVIQSMYLL